MKNKIIGIVLLIIGAMTVSLGIFMLMGSSKGGALIKDAIYVGESPWQAENEGELIIVTGDLNLTESAYDTELGITLNSPRVIKHAQNIKWKKNLQESKKRDKNMFGWEWETLILENNTYYGEAMVNDFKLSNNLLEKIPISETYKDYNESELNEVGLILIEDTDFVQRYFIEDLVWRGPDNMGYYFDFAINPDNYDDVIRYYYSAYIPEDHDGITAIGIQNQDTLDLHEDISSNSFMDGKLNQDEVIKQFKSSSNIAFITSMVIGIACLIIGRVFIVRSRR